MGWKFSRFHSPDIHKSILSLVEGPDVWASSECQPLPTSSRKQCIELEQQFDFLKDLVASVPDMQGDGRQPHGWGQGSPWVSARDQCQVGKAKAPGLGDGWGVVKEWGDLWADVLYLPGKGNRARQQWPEERWDGKQRQGQAVGTDSEQEVSEALGFWPIG